ncbi:MAG TPA: flagellin protein [Firmicutes bacterium]|nr:flagellin protein [Bacillota bacterium]
MAQGDLTRINSNIAGLNALNALKAINTKLGIHQLRLSTGKRINEAADDPAGLTIGIKFNARVRGLGVALDNIGDAKNLLAVAEGGLSKINDILLTVRDKVAQAANDTLGASERKAIAAQIKSLLQEVDTIARETQWNKQELLTGNFNSTNPMKFQTGPEVAQKTEFTLANNHTTAGLEAEFTTYANEKTDSPIISNILATSVAAGETELAYGDYTIEATYDSTTGNPITGTIFLRDASGMELASIDAVSVSVTGLWDTGLGIQVTLATSSNAGTATATVNYTSDVGTYDNAQKYLEKIDKAIAIVSQSMTDIGALVSRLTSKEENLTIAKANTEAAYSRIMNADMASEQLEAMKLSILQQTATAMLAQANVAPQAVLSLFR